ncbi:hypothetical protein JCM10213_001160 [Rhodosporidiobolus nylandii]
MPLDGEDEALLPSPSRAALREHAQDDAKGYRRVLRGFIAYSVASEVFIIVAGTLFLPVLLETFARSNGRLAPLHEVRCPPSGVDGGDGTGEDAPRCDVRLLGVWVDTASFALLTYSVSVALQAFTVISMGALADDPRTRHRLLTLFAIVGSLLTIAFLLLPETSVLWPLCTVLAAGANVCFGASIVCLNSYLPELGRRDPVVLKLHAAMLAAQAEEARRPTHWVSEAPWQYQRARAVATSRISSRAIAAGYAAGIGGLVALLPVVSALGGQEGGTWTLRVAIAASGAWWLIGTLPAAIWLRPSPSLYADSAGAPDRPVSFGAQIKRGWRGLGTMLGEYRRLPQTFVFLAAWFVLSDCFATLTSTAMLFAKTSLNLPTSSLILIAILTPLSGLFGAVVFPLVQKRGTAELSSSTRRTSFDNHTMLLLIVSLSLLVPVWGLVHLRSAGEMYALACVFGTLYGSFQAYSRTCFAQLVPSSQSARWFGLYSITDKSSSFLGPALVALLTNATGQIRDGFYIILSLLLISLPILAAVRIARGSQAADTYDEELKERATREGEGDDEGEPLYNAARGEDEEA